MRAVRGFVGSWSFLAVTSFATPAASLAQQQPVPPNATAVCRDGSYSFSRHRSGTCSHHGGVAMWLGAGDSAPAPPARREPPERRGPACGIACGTERWRVKTLSDPDRGHVALEQIVDATVTELVTVPRPPVLSPVVRADPVERTVYRVAARLLFLFSERDLDYHLVLASPDNLTVTMIAEVPDPGCADACASGHAQAYARVRQKLMEYLDSPQSQVRPLVRVTGVGFFDYLHGQRGVAPNGIELHPVLDVEFPESGQARRRAPSAAAGVPDPARDRRLPPRRSPP